MNKSNLKNKKLFLLDMDGTLYIDEYLFPDTKAFLDQIKANGASYVYLSNNSSRGKDAYVAKLKRLGIKSEEKEFLTSVDATIDYLKSTYPMWNDKVNPTSFFVCGTKTFEKQLMDAGLCIVTKLDITPEQFKALKSGDNTLPTCSNEAHDIAEANEVLDVTEAKLLPDVALLSFDTEITYKKIEDFTVMLMAGRDYIATHPDFLCPSWYGMAVDIGCYIDMFRTATGREPYIVGKPQPQMALTAMKKYGCSPEETCIIGDRLTTDIACGNNAGIDSIFVLCGDHKIPDIDKYNIRPTYIFNDIGEVLNEIK